MPNINAALLISQLSRLKKILDKKRILFESYEKLFKNSNDLKLVREPKNCKKQLLASNSYNKK